MPRREKGSYGLKPRLRVVAGNDIVLGPGKADLLDAVDAAGELRAAANRLGMSYMRAWTLLREMNRAFGRPVVETFRGGSAHGAARLTPLGRRVLVLYREMERRSAAAAAPAWRRLRRLLPSGRGTRQAAGSPPQTSSPTKRIRNT
jgi:molybdate transport system regulatory protein